jgi:hypothetical protein
MGGERTGRPHVTSCFWSAEQDVRAAHLCPTVDAFSSRCISAHIGSEDPAEVPLTQCDDMVYALAPDRTD